MRWPAGFGRRFVLTVDTEEEFDWGLPLSRDARATTAASAIPAAHRRLANGGAIAHYLIDHPVATDSAAVDALLRATGGIAGLIGAQLHPWVNPPHAERVGTAESFAGNLPRDLEAAKIATLTAAITASFGTPPRAFRAGRYGLGPHSLSLLAGAGYRVDCSVRSRFDYRVEGGPDFRACGGAAWREAGLVELPLTTVFTGALRRVGADVFPAIGRIPKARGLFGRTGLLRRVPLTPEGVAADLACRAIDVAIGSDVQVLHLAFHSPSLVAGHTPYVRDADDLRVFWQWWDVVLAHLARRDIRAATLDEIETAADSGSEAG